MYSLAAACETARSFNTRKYCLRWASASLPCTPWAPSSRKRYRFWGSVILASPFAAPFVAACGRGGALFLVVAAAGRLSPLAGSHSTRNATSGSPFGCRIVKCHRVCPFVSISILLSLGPESEELAELGGGLERGRGRHLAHRSREGVVESPHRPRLDIRHLGRRVKVTARHLCEEAER